MISVLYVDDDPPLCEICKIFLERSGDFDIDTNISAKAALNTLKERSFDCIVSDYQMPEMDGIRFLQALRSRKDMTPFIIFTGKGREEVAMQALNSGADFYLQKGGGRDVQFVELAHMITQSVRRKKGEEALRLSEQRYRAVVEGQTEFISRFLPDGTHVFVNEAYCRYYNKTREEILGTRFIPGIPKSEQALVKKHFASLTPDHPVATIEHRNIMPDGQVRWQWWSDRAIFNPDGRVTEYQSVGQDITDRKEAEELVKISELRYRSLFESVPVGLYRIAPDGKILDVNPALVQILGYPDRKSLLAKNVRELHSEPKDQNGWQACIAREGVVYGFEVQLQKFDKTVIWVRTTSRAVRDEYGDIQYVEGILEDITGRRQAEEKLEDMNLALHAAYGQLAATEIELRQKYNELFSTEKELRESEGKYREFVELLPEPVFEIDNEGMILFTNPVGFQSFGYGQEDLKRGVNAFEMLVPQDRERAGKNIRRILNGETLGGLEYTALRKDGSTFPIIIHSSPIIRENRPVGLRGILFDMTKLKEAEDALEESEMRYRVIFENTGTATILVDESTIISHVNSEFEKLSGYSKEEIEGIRSWTELVVKEDVDWMLSQHHLRREKRDAALKKYEFRFIKKSGEIRDCILTVDMIPGTKKSVASLVDVIEKGPERFAADHHFSNS